MGRGGATGGGGTIPVDYRTQQAGDEVLDVHVASGCWSNGSGGLWLLVKWFRWPLDVVACGCCWSDGAGGLWMFLFKESRWPLDVAGQIVQVVSGCCGLWLLLVKWFRWPLGVVGQSVQVASGRHKGISHSLPGEAGLLPLKQSKLRTHE